MSILMGLASRTYKFALGRALLNYAAEGADQVPSEDIAASFAMVMARRPDDMPQGPWRNTTTDYLTVLIEEREESLTTGSPTERLVLAANRAIVMAACKTFHNLPGKTPLPHSFFHVQERMAGGHDFILAPALLELAGSKQRLLLDLELEARWSLVEHSVHAGIGPSLIADGVLVDLPNRWLLDKRRRRSVTGLVDAVIGFQHGRCLICGDPISLGEAVAVDHVFPYVFMSRGITNVDLDSVWNLAPAHATCNATKSSRPPTTLEVERLTRRNIAIMGSPHPLRRTLQVTLSRSGLPQRPDCWPRFMRSVLQL